MIIAILNQKGGVGKTTLSVHMASTLALAGNKVLLIDADVQRSALDWAASREKNPIFTVVGIPKNNIHKEIQLLKSNYDFIVIDGPPRVYDVARSAIAASDVILIPIQPSPYDVWSAKEVVDLVNEVKEPLLVYKKIKVAFVINRKISYLFREGNNETHLQRKRPSAVRSGTGLRTPAVAGDPGGHDRGARDHQRQRFTGRRL